MLRIKRSWDQLPVPSITSIGNVSCKPMYRASRDLRGPAGSIGLRPVAWKPATLSVVGEMLLKLESLSEDWGTIGWLRELVAFRPKEAGFIAWVVKVRRAAMIRHCCCCRVGRTIVAIVSGKEDDLSFIYSTPVLEEWVTLRGRGSCKQISPAVIGGKSRSEPGQIQPLFSLAKSWQARNRLSSIALYQTAMASRRLALNLNQALRSRAALKSISPIRRGFATPIHQGINTESTTLSNGFTVRSPLVHIYFRN